MDSAFATTKDHLREELMKGLVTYTQVRALAKLTTNKLVKKILLKFLETFFDEFFIAIWIPRCEQMILYEY